MRFLVRGSTSDRPVCQVQKSKTNWKFTFEDGSVCKSIHAATRRAIDIGSVEGVYVRDDEIRGSSGKCVYVVLCTWRATSSRPSDADRHHPVGATGRKMCGDVYPRSGGSSLA